MCAIVSDRSALSPRFDGGGNGKRQSQARVPGSSTGEETMGRLRFATVWVGGCSGCHMSFLDLDEWLIDLAAKVDLVYSPLMDTKDYPDDVDIVLVEGAVANAENLQMIHHLRARSRYVISFGDCAVTGNVTSLRNPLGLALE